MTDYLFFAAVFFGAAFFLAVADFLEVARFLVPHFFFPPNAACQLSAYFFVEPIRVILTEVLLVS